MTTPLVRMPDGTVKQVNPFSGTQVWTLPGRGHRPVQMTRSAPKPLRANDAENACAFCSDRKLEVTPELARLVPLGVPGEPSRYWDLVRGVLAEDLDATVADFRLVSNLFEILSYDYWRTAHGYHANPTQLAHENAYLSTPLGREQVISLVRGKARAAGYSESDLHRRTFEDDLADAAAFFAGNHQVVIPRRHYVDGATDDSQLASAGTLTPEEHAAYIGLTVTAIEDLYRNNPWAKYVAAYQNWLSPAGASFEHLHKQVVAIDDVGRAMRRELKKLRRDPAMYRRWGPDYSREQGLIVAENEHAVAFAGVGHRFPSLELHVRDHDRRPWEYTPEQLRDVSDLLHALHAAVGVHVSTNEEWHMRPPSVDAPMPLRIVIKLRISTPAGFEGGTKININTIDPFTIAARTLSRLRELEREGAISPRVHVD